MVMMTPLSHIITIAAATHELGTGWLVMQEEESGALMRGVEPPRSMAVASAEQQPQATKMEKGKEKKRTRRRRVRRGAAYSKVRAKDEASVSELTTIPDVPELLRSGDAEKGEAAQVFLGDPKEAASTREARRELYFRMERENIAATMRDDLDQIKAGRYPGHKQFKLVNVVACGQGVEWRLRFEAPGGFFRLARQLAKQRARPGQSRTQRKKDAWFAMRRASATYWVDENLLPCFKLVCIAKDNAPLAVFKLTSEQPWHPERTKALFEVRAEPVSEHGTDCARSAALELQQGRPGSLKLVQLSEGTFCEGLLDKLRGPLRTPFDDLLWPRRNDRSGTREPEEEVGNSWPGLAVESLPREMENVVQDLERLPGDEDLRSLLGVTGAKTPIKLHKSQRRAVRQCLLQRVALIQGPPGTGKTFIAALLCALMLKHGLTVMVVCKTNHALDQVLELTEDLGVPRSRLVRLGQSPKVSERAWRMRRKAEFFKHAGKSKKAFVVGCTTSGAANPVHDGKIAKLRPAVMLLEEAGEVTEPGLEGALHPSLKRLVLIGDHEQLPPLVHAPELLSKSGNDYELDVSTLQRLVQEGFKCTQLLVQYRQQPELADIIRATTYPNLIDAPSTKVRSPKFAPGMALTVGAFVDHSWPEELRWSSWRNKGEARIVLQIVQHCVAQGDDFDIAVITPYIAQRDLLQEMLSEAGVPVTTVETEAAANQVAATRSRRRRAAPSPRDSVRVATVDSFQGEEARLVIFSAVRSNRRGEIGFLKLPQRVNVALSRARDGLVVVGNRRTLTARSFAGSGGNVWHTFFDTAEKSSGWTVSDALHVSCSRHPHAPEWRLLFDSPSSSSSSPPASASRVCAACAST